MGARGDRRSRALKITLTYDGTDFVGWQRQAEGVSIQGLIEEALARIEGRAVPVAGAGRTDAGVHALGQVASFVLSHAIDPASLERALNTMLPADVRVLGVEEAAEGFHARYGARAKTYRYLIATGDVVSPFERRYVWHVSQPLAVEAMMAAAQAVVGRHDFAAFQAAGSSAAATVRTVFESTVVMTDLVGVAGVLPKLIPDEWSDRSPLLVYQVTGDGFLRHMVRAIVGTLVDIGTGRRGPGAIAQALATCARQDVGPTAPACGLTLVRVVYDS